MIKNNNDNKQVIGVSQVLLQILIMCVIFITAFYTDKSTKEIVTVSAFLVAFFVSIYMHRFFFPFILLSVTCYLLASIQELFAVEYAQAKITKILWTVGNFSFPIGILHFTYKLLFKFKITDIDG